jgi:DNA-binding NtrC family response regulator
MSSGRDAFHGSDAVSESRAIRPNTILFVEDEALVRMDMAEFLREHGYCVHETGSAREAIDALQAKSGIDLVFTDISLPEGMNGLELAEWTLCHQPRIKVLVTTGDASRMAEVPPTIESLAKPYTGRDLVDEVEKVLKQ